MRIRTNNDRSGSERSKILGILIQIHITGCTIRCFSEARVTKTTVALRPAAAAGTHAAPRPRATGAGVPLDAGPRPPGLPSSLPRPPSSFSYLAFSAIKRRTSGLRKSCSIPDFICSVIARNQRIQVLNMTVTVFFGFRIRNTTTFQQTLRYKFSMCVQHDLFDGLSRLTSTLSAGRNRFFESLYPVSRSFVLRLLIGTYLSIVKNSQQCCNTQLSQFHEPFSIPMPVDLRQPCFGHGASLFCWDTSHILSYIEILFLVSLVKEFSDFRTLELRGFNLVLEVTYLHTLFSESMD
jgi:hypothetical protein